jgi:hypothetical protein
MSDFKAWIPPAGEVVKAPVHPQTTVMTMWSDGSLDDDFTPAGDLNWSSVGDGPGIVAYCVVSEYKPAPEPQDYWIVSSGFALASREMAELNNPLGLPIIHVREVLPAAREVVAWAVVDEDSFNCFYEKRWADGLAKQNGGTVVKLSGVMP